MLSETSGTETGRVSFPDCLITDFICDGKALRFSSSGVYVDGIGLLNQPTKVELIGQQGSVEVRSFNFNDDRWIKIDPHDACLRDICEWSHDGAGVRLAGFGTKSGMWQEYFVPDALLRLAVGQ